MTGMIEFDGPLTSDVLMFQDLIGLSFQGSTFLKILTGLWILEIGFFCMEALSNHMSLRRTVRRITGVQLLNTLGFMVFVFSPINLQ